MDTVRKIRPALFIVFEKNWANCLSSLHRELTEKYGAVGSAFQALLFKHDGIYDLITDERVLELAELCEELKEDCWKSNHNVLFGNIERFEKLFGQYITNAVDTKYTKELAKNDIVLIENISIFIISSLHHPVGSPGINVLLNSIYRVFKYSYPTILHSTLLLLTSPDIVQSDYDIDACIMRSCRVLEELEILYTNIEDDISDPYFDVLWLYSKLNEGGKSISNIADIEYQVSTYLKLLLIDALPKDESFLHVLFQKKNGRTRICSGMGLSAVNMPRDVIVSNIMNRLVSKYKKELLDMYPEDIDDNTMNKANRDFMEIYNFSNIKSRLEQYDGESAFNNRILDDSIVIEQYADRDIQEAYKGFNLKQEKLLYKKIDNIISAKTDLSSDYMTKLTEYTNNMAQKDYLGFCVSEKVYRNVLNSSELSVGQQDDIELFPRISSLTEIAAANYREMLSIYHDKSEYDKHIARLKELQEQSDQHNKELSEKREILETLVSKSRDETDLENEEHLNNTKNELEQLKVKTGLIEKEKSLVEDEVNSRRKEIEESDKLLENPDSRTELIKNKIESLRTKANARIYNLSEMIKEKKRVREDIDDLNAAHSIRRIISIVITVLLLLCTTYLLIKHFAEFNTRIVPVIIIVIAELIFLLSIYFYYSSKIAKLQNVLGNIQGSIDSDLDSASKLRNQEYKIRYNDAICKNILRINDEYQNNLRSICETINGFFNTIEEVEYLVKEDDSVDTSFRIDVPDRDEYIAISDRVIDSQNMKELLTSNRYMYYWKEYKSNGDSIAKIMFADLERCIEANLTEVYSGNIEKLIGSDQHQESIYKAVQTASKLSSPFISTSIEPGLDDSVKYHIVFVGSGNVEGITKIYDLPHGAAILQGFNDCEIVFMNLKYGIPLPELSIFKRRQGISNNKSYHDNIVCDDTLSHRIDDLRSRSESDDERFETFLVAEAFKIINKKNDRYIYKNWKCKDSRIEACKNLFADKKAYSSIQKAVEQVMQEDEAKALLEAAIRELELNSNDVEILHAVIRRLSPIS